MDVSILFFKIYLKVKLSFNHVIIDLSELTESNFHLKYNISISV